MFYSTSTARYGPHPRTIRTYLPTHCGSHCTDVDNIFFLLFKMKKKNTIIITLMSARNGSMINSKKNLFFQILCVRTTKLFVGAVKSFRAVTPSSGQLLTRNFAIKRGIINRL